MSSLPRTGLRLMHVHAHPDDESSKGAASTAKYVSEGVNVHVVTCTGGERGSILNPNMERPGILANIAEIRRREMQAACESLGVTQDWLGFVDSGWFGSEPPPLPEGCFAAMDVADAAEPVVRLIRSFRPHVVTTYDERGGYPHPDHIMCHKVAVAAFGAASDPSRYPNAGEPWQPLKLYYHHTFSRARSQALSDAMDAQGLESPLVESLDAWTPDPEWNGTYAAELLAAGEPLAAAWRFGILQTVDDYTSVLRRSDPTRAASVFDEPPAPTGAVELDAAFAALADHLAERDGWDTPRMGARPDPHGRGLVPRRARHLPCRSRTRQSPSVSSARDLHHQAITQPGLNPPRSPGAAASRAGTRSPQLVEAPGEAGGAARRCPRAWSSSLVTLRVGRGPRRPRLRSERSARRGRPGPTPRHSG
ncbi:mycothiol S-conjugate amidase Mca [Gordonia otitidis NBRC 100426]|uniref:Mycothiol S-conjugate amidase Mca n=1 Tax=Gordonia otitidis (strain DSM 44809 / CCUG 52243 / JCM 12355 / NBRC 100426 / IFM 10032) TaxID=1108044 RepID=H5TIP3_GORO1|nr:mycothiol S-conjugate amidase Mca [Gordonia otitidis NBRC 100426]